MIPLTRLLALAVAGCLLLPGAAAAQAAKIGVVDTTRAAANSKEGQSAEKRLRDIRERKRDEFKPKDDQLRKLRDEYETQKYVLSRDALQEREIELLKLQRNMERDLQAAQEEFEIEQRKLMQPILKDILETVKEVARDRDLDVVLEKTSPGVLFYSDTLDITEDVIKRLNES